MARETSSRQPEGFRYLADFLTSEEEAILLTHIERLPFAEIKMHGVVAKRRTVHFGWVYGYESWQLTPGPPIPDFLAPWCRRAAELMQTEVSHIEEVLVTEYVHGSGIGWHRDAPIFGACVVGLSLLSPCRFRFQRTPAGQRETCTLTLEPRSAYVLSGPARFQWQHSIPVTKATRYSITFRTLRRKPTRNDAGTMTKDGRSEECAG